MNKPHSLAKTHASFDDPNLVSRAGLVPVMALAGAPGLAGLVRGARPSRAANAGSNAHLKVPCLVAGMAAGADSIADMDVLRHGAMSTLFGGVRAPSTLGSHLRCYTWGNMSQLEKAARPAARRPGRPHRRGERGGDRPGRRLARHRRRRRVGADLGPRHCWHQSRHAGRPPACRLCLEPIRPVARRRRRRRLVPFHLLRGINKLQHVHHHRRSSSVGHRPAAPEPETGKAGRHS